MVTLFPLHPVTLEGVLGRAGGGGGGSVGRGRLHSFVGHHSRGKLLLRLLKAGAGRAVQPVHLRGENRSGNGASHSSADQQQSLKRKVKPIGGEMRFVYLRDSQMRTWNFFPQTFEFFIVLLHT